MREAERIIYQTRAAYIAALVDDVELVAAEELPGCNRGVRSRARKTGEVYARKAITAELWSRIEGDSEAQAEIAAQFLAMARQAIGEAFDEMKMRRYMAV